MWWGCSCMTGGIPWLNGRLQLAVTSLWTGVLCGLAAGALTAYRRPVQVGKNRQESGSPVRSPRLWRYGTSREEIDGQAGDVVGHERKPERQWYDQRALTLADPLEH